MSGQLSPDLASTGSSTTDAGSQPSASASSTLSTRPRPLSGSPAHLHFASDVLPNSSARHAMSSNGGGGGDVPTPPTTARSTGRRTPVRSASTATVPDQFRRASLRAPSPDHIVSPNIQERRASLAASTAYGTAPSTVRRASVGRRKPHVRREDAELWEFGEVGVAGPSGSAVGSGSHRRGSTAPSAEEEEFQQRLARLDLNRVIQAIQASPPRQDHTSPPISSSVNTAGPLTNRRSSYGINSVITLPPKLVPQVEKTSSGTAPVHFQDLAREAQREKRGLLRDLLPNSKGKGKEKLNTVEEEERLRREEAQRAERIRLIHANVTPSTFARAQSAKQQFEVRYNLLDSHTSAQWQSAGRRSPTFLSVIKWKKGTREIDRLKRRTEAATSRAALLALNRSSPLTRVDSGDSSRRVPFPESNISSPAAPSSRRPSMASASNVPLGASFISVDDPSVSAWAEQLILSKRRRKRSVLSGSNSLASGLGVGSGSGSLSMVAGTTKAFDWDFTAKDIQDFLGAHGEVESFVPPSTGDELVHSDRERGHSLELDLERILEASPTRTSTRSAPSFPTDKRKSAPPSITSIASITSDEEGPASQRKPVSLPLAKRVSVKLVPPSTGKRRLTSLDEHDSPTSDAPPNRHPPSAPESPVQNKPRYGRTHSMGRPGSIGQAIGSLLTMSGSQEAFSSRQSLNNKRRSGGPGRPPPSELEAAGSAEASASELPMSAVNSDVDSGHESKRGQLAGRGKRRRPDGSSDVHLETGISSVVDSARSSIKSHKRKIPSISFMRRAPIVAEGDGQAEAEGDSMPTPKPLMFNFPEIPMLERRATETLEEEEENNMDSQDEEEEYEKKSRNLGGLRSQIARMDNIIANSRVRNLCQELLDMREQTFVVGGGLPIPLPALSASIRTIIPRPRMLHQFQGNGGEIPGRPQLTMPWMQRNLGKFPAQNMPSRSASMPFPGRDDDSERYPHVPPSRSLSTTSEADIHIDIFPQIEHHLDGISVQWQEVEQRVDGLLTQQKSAFNRHAEVQGGIDEVQTVYFEQSQVMDRLDDRIHTLKTRNLGDSMMFSFLAALTEALLFSVWLIAKITQVILFKMPKFAYRCVIRFIAFIWWLIRWLLFLDYLWPSST